jgi:hypothetical protein
VDFVRRWSEKTKIGAGRFIGWLDITASKFYDWRERYGKVNEHNGWVLLAMGSSNRTSPRGCGVSTSGLSTVRE